VRVLKAKAGPFRLRFEVRDPQTDQVASEHPDEQLTLIQEEIGRQRPILVQRIGGMHTRASLLVTASGVVTVFQAKLPDVGWQYVSVVLGVGAALAGLISLRPKAGEDALASKFIDERLDADTYSVRRSIVDDAAQSLNNDVEHLNRLGKTITFGYRLLVASLFLSMVISGLHYFKFI